MDLFLDCLLDAGLDAMKLLPFLFVTYLVMEALERRTQERSGQLIRHDHAGPFGPVFGALVGAVPQCGFSAAAASLYSGGLISIGTLMAVFLSTSDEMLPLLISARVPVGTLLRILVCKAVVGLVSGVTLDFALRRILRRRGTRMRPESRQKEGSDPASLPLQLEPKYIHDLCREEHCGCEEDRRGILHSALVHTGHIVVFVFLITLVLNLVVEGFGEDVIRGRLIGAPAVGIFLTAAVGLIPNCAASILITQLYLDGLIAAGQMMSGLLVGAGVGLLVLFRTNDRHPRENVVITVMLYLLGIVWGFLLTAAGISFTI